MSRHFGGVPTRRGPDQKTILLIVSAFFLAIFVIIAIFLLKKGEASQPTIVQNGSNDINMVSVLVPVRRVDEGEKLSRDMFKVELRSRFALSDGYVGKFVQIDGRFAKSLIVPGQPLYQDYITQYSPNSPIVMKIPDGSRAVSIKVDATSGVEGWIRPGSLVDVQWITKMNGEDTLLKLVERAEVLSAEKSVITTNQPTVTNVPTTVTLLVKTEDADRIALASGRGRLNLVLRNYEEETTPETETPIRVGDIIKPTRVTPRAPQRKSCQGQLVVGGIKYCVCNGEMMEPGPDGKC